MKKAYAKVKAQEQPGSDGLHQQAAVEPPAAEPASLEMHPSRQAMLDDNTTLGRAPRRSSVDMDDLNKYQRGVRRTKPSSYSKEAQVAAQRQLEAEARQKAREEKDKDRRAMLRARRPTKDGSYRLGRQSKVLLQRVKKIIVEG